MSNTSNTAATPTIISNQKLNLGSMKLKINIDTTNTLNSEDIFQNLQPEIPQPGSAAASRKKTQRSPKAKPANNPEATGGDESEDTATDIAAPASHVFNYEIKESMFTKEELAIDPSKDIFVQYSKAKNENLIKYFILKYSLIDYKCAGKSCPIKNGLWRRKPTYMILVRKNNEHYDLRLTNLIMYCPNCFCQDKGATEFAKAVKRMCNQCVTCGTEVDPKYKSNMCYRCKMAINKKSKEILIEDVVNTAVYSSSSNAVVKQQESAKLAELLTDDSMFEQHVSSRMKYRVASKAPKHTIRHSMPVSESGLLNTALDTDLLNSLANIIDS